jgi:hypothetical protein
MSNYLQGTQIRKLLLGLKVEEPAAVLPATGIAHLFTVSGGRVLITGLIGQCTTVCDSTATTITVGVTPTSGTASAASLASATAITSKEVGTLVGLPLTAGGALVVGANAGGTAQVSGRGAMVVQPGTIDITTSATNAGAFKWTLTYIPLDDGASVKAV